MEALSAFDALAAVQVSWKRTKLLVPSILAEMLLIDRFIKSYSSTPFTRTKGHPRV